MRRADRLFQLVLLLQRGRVITARELARELQVSERTVYRDIQALVLSGVPLEGEAGVGYVLRREFELPPLMFTVEEAQALALGANMVKAWGDARLKQAAQRILDKVKAIATPDVAQGLSDRALWVPEFHVDDGMRQKLAVFRDAIHERRPAQFRYIRADGASSRRTVRPLGLFYWGQTWSLGAWCELRQNFRNFRLDRMGEPRLLKRTFAPEPGKTLDDYLAAVED